MSLLVFLAVLACHARLVSILDYLGRRILVVLMWTITVVEFALVATIYLILAGIEGLWYSRREAFLLIWFLHMLLANASLGTLGASISSGSLESDHMEPLNRTWVPVDAWFRTGVHVPVRHLPSHRRHRARSLPAVRSSIPFQPFVDPWDEATRGN